MRRLLLSAATLLPLAVFVGCHESGKCDCDLQPTIYCRSCCHPPYPETHADVGALAKPETIKVAPKEEVKPPKEEPKPVNPDK